MICVSIISVEGVLVTMGLALVLLRRVFAAKTREPAAREAAAPHVVISL